MKKNEALQLLSYVGVSVLSVGAAFLISLQFIGGSRAQEGEVPAQPPQQEQAPPMPLETEPQPPVGTPPDASAQPQEAAPQGNPPSEAPATGGGGSSLAEIEGFLEPFIYDIVNRRDPFLAYAEFVPASGDDGGNGRPISPAQKFAIEDLRLVGVMWDVKEPKALFQDPEEEIHSLGRDDSIGNRNGYIAAIREGEVVVVEAIRKRGDIIYRTKVVRIER